MATLNPTLKRQFIDNLTYWYDKHGRHDLPWREPDRSPYEILIAEFMLQQTQVKQAEEFYIKFLELYPTPEALAESPLEKIESVIEPLGLSYRAERMKKSAEQIQIQHDGQVPSTYTELTDLYGVGDYIANSILIHAFGQSRGTIDVNIARILSRFFHVQTSNRPRNDDDLWALAEELVPEERPSDYTHALLDLGSAVCTIENPDCQQCPLKSECAYYVDQKKD